MHRPVHAPPGCLINNTHYKFPPIGHREPYNLLPTIDLPPPQYYDLQEDLALDLAIYATIGGYKFIIRYSHIKNTGRLTILYAYNRFHKGY